MVPSRLLRHRSHLRHMNRPRPPTIPPRPPQTPTPTLCRSGGVQGAAYRRTSNEQRRPTKRATSVRIVPSGGTGLVAAPDPGTRVQERVKCAPTGTTSKCTPLMAGRQTIAVLSTSRRHPRRTPRRHPSRRRRPRCCARRVSSWAQAHPGSAPTAKRERISHSARPHPPLRPSRVPRLVWQLRPKAPRPRIAGPYSFDPTLGELPCEACPPGKFANRRPALVHMLRTHMLCFSARAVQLVQYGAVAGPACPGVTTVCVSARAAWVSPAAIN